MKIKGGDKVKLKNGRTVEVADIKNEMIMVTCVEWYSFDDIEAVVERIRA